MKPVVVSRRALQTGDSLEEVLQDQVNCGVRVNPAAGVAERFVDAEQTSGRNRLRGVGERSFFFIADRADHEVAIRAFEHVEEGAEALALGLERLAGGLGPFEHLVGNLEHVLLRQRQNAGEYLPADFEAAGFDQLQGAVHGAVGQAHGSGDVRLVETGPAREDGADVLGGERLESNFLAARAQRRQQGARARRGEDQQRGGRRLFEGFQKRVGGLFGERVGIAEDRYSPVALDGHQAERVDEVLNLLDLDDAAVALRLEEQEVGVAVMRKEPAILAQPAGALALAAAEQRFGGLLREERFADAVGAGEEVGMPDPVRREGRGQAQLGLLLPERVAERQGRRCELSLRAGRGRRLTLLRRLQRLFRPRQSTP